LSAHVYFHNPLAIQQTGYKAQYSLCFDNKGKVQHPNNDA